MSSFLEPYSHLVDFSQRSLLISTFAIAFNPTFWNIVARREYRTRFITRAFGSAQAGCYALAVTIFSLGLLRDFLYERALRAQPSHPLLEGDLPTYAGYVLLAFGNLLVISSTWQLGITGTFLGDYFGILMDDIVTGFPFNITNAPMYYGSTMSFLGSALVYGKPAGIFLTGVVLVVYLVAIQYENPFTAGIYAKRGQQTAAISSAKKAKKVEGKKEL
ncbi:phospholipid methyltransferase-domain-containing protein [Bombardia bombarda]|uniref:Phosphatidyl-N-methylethanolamine N-methyltransferase n=1 Tax=Bombardia bombarda TaxID=252184 RepID=A0AA39X7U1_9PEZI|nr:phospholipid methyltransferase-domain-containing protein [Bombardia bombarda]